jgi:hypothetical protein
MAAGPSHHKDTRNSPLKTSGDQAVARLRQALLQPRNLPAGPACAPVKREVYANRAPARVESLTSLVRGAVERGPPAPPRSMRARCLALAASTTRAARQRVDITTMRP